MSTRWRIVLLVCLALSLFMMPLTGLAEDGIALSIELTGDIEGAPFVIRVPEAWNGTLLVFAHGYNADPTTTPDAAMLGESGATLLLANGYALAASGFRNAGWTVEEGIQDTRRLVLYFKETIAHPERVILWGQSMGTVVVLKSMERYHGLYDAAVPICSVAMGASRNADLKLDYTVAYAAAFGWEESWGDIGDLPDGIAGIDGFNALFGTFLGQMADPSNLARFEFMRLVNDMPYGGFYSGNGALPPGVMVNMVLGYYMRWELEERAGGPVAQNADHVYKLTEDEIAYVEGLDPSFDAEAALAQMAAMATIEARRSARSYLERYADFSGRIQAPVLMLHNIEDPMALVEGTTPYANDVAAQGNADLLMRVYTNRIGHCNATPEQVLALMTAMAGWLDSGARPGPEAFPAAQEFVLDFEPGPWPQPPVE